jgi:hypothetical protein
MECGFFNSKGEDRLYNAEHFTSYLSSMICNGVQDTVGECFAPSVSEDDGLLLTIGSGKAWINGHYAQTTTSEKLDLSAYVDESLGRCVAVGVYCDTSESVRDCGFEVLAGTCSGSPRPPKFSNTESRTYLTICTVRLRPGAASILSGDVTDCRNDETLCGYCKCILGKCRVTELLKKMDDVLETVSDLESQVADLTERVNSITGEILATGQCGENAFYVQYSDGTLNIKGSGSLYDYEDEKSPFYGSEHLSELKIAEGVTVIGAYAFQCCPSLRSVILPNTVTTIGARAFSGTIVSGKPQTALTEIRIPNSVTSIGENAFFHSFLTEVTIPSSVVSVGAYAFAQCLLLKTATVQSTVMSLEMFGSALKLDHLTISQNVKKIQAGALQYCESLSQINYEGTVSQWNAIEKATNWTGYDDDTPSHKTHLSKIICTDGTLVWNDADGWTKEET